MNASINSLLGPLEAATRQGSWEDAEDIAREISRMSRLQRLSELQKIQEALVGYQGYMKLKQPIRCPQIAPRGSHVAKTPLPGAGLTPIKQGKSTMVPSILNQKTPLGPSCEEQWPFG